MWKGLLITAVVAVAAVALANRIPQVRDLVRG